MPSSATAPRRRWPLWLGIAAAWFLWGTISTLRLAPAPDLSWSQAFWYGFPDAMIWGALTPFVVAFARRFPLRWDRLWPTLAYHCAAALSFALLHAGADATVAALRNWGTSEDPIWVIVFFKVLAYGGHTNLLVYILIGGMVHYLDYTRRLAESERHEAELRAQLAAAQLANLERQLRPHFLFNSLNTIAGLMDEGAGRGRRVVRQLGDLLRASLKLQPGQRIPLHEELALVRDYLEIEQVRFEDRLTLHFDIEKNERVNRFPVPALILQPLVENAVIHGVASRPEGGRVQVRARWVGDDLELSIEDDGPGFAPNATTGDHEGLGVGLSATRQRLLTLYGDAGLLSIEEPDGGGTRLRLRLPSRTAAPRAVSDVEPSP